MDVLTILQFITIAISIASLVLGYVYATKEKNKNNKTEIFSKKLVENIHILRENMEVILSMANPYTLREQLHFNTIKSIYITNISVDNVEKAISNIKSIFFPFYPQENHFLATLDSLRASIYDYLDTPKSKRKEMILKKKIRQVYMEYAVYDKAMSDAIEKQTTENSFGYDTFDAFYEKIASEQNIKTLRSTYKAFTRMRQSQSVDKKVAQDLVIMNNKKKRAKTS